MLAEAMGHYPDPQSPAADPLSSSFARSEAKAQQAVMVSAFALFTEFQHKKGGSHEVSINA
jgi:hypothetical protein